MLRRGAILLGLVGGSVHAQGALLEVLSSGDVGALGASVAGAGDVDLDGLPDVLAGAPDTGYLGVFAGAAYVRAGGSGEELLRLYGKTSGDDFGTAVAGVGDIDGDGHPDVAVTAPGNIGDRYVRVLSGVDGHVLLHLVGSGNGKFGTAVAGPGDVDADGWPDILVGAPLSGSPGYVRVYSGATGDVLIHIDDDPVFFASDDLGASVSWIGDVNHDGHADLAVGAPGDHQIESVDNGAARIYSGRDGHLLHKFLGADNNDLLGTSIAGCGDVDGDGTGDLLAGAPSEGASGYDDGALYLISGATGAALLHIPSEHIGERLGEVVAGGGDFDGDGIPDLISSAAAAVQIGPSYYSSRSVKVFSGLDGALLATLQGGTTKETLWSPPLAVACAGDFNDNGHPDLAVGLPSLMGPTFFTKSKLAVFEMHCGTIEEVGDSCTGTLGVAPDLSVTGCATPGGTLAVSVDGPPVPTLLLVGLGSADVLLPSGCSLLVSGLVAVVPVTPGASVSDTLPLGIVGLGLDLQAFSVLAGGMAASQGVQVLVE
jgi:hypothetical protein